VTALPHRRRDGALVEREAELDALDGLVAAALRGEPVLGLVEGPAGVGKSRLVSAAGAKAAAAGMRVLTARGGDLERELPFGVVRQLLEPVLADAAGRERWLTAAAEPAVRVFAPPVDAAQDVADVSFRLIDGLFWLTANIAADGPLLLAIDDLHWCDRASLRFLAYLERRLEGLHVLVVAAARDGEPGTDARLLAEIADDPAAVTLRPQPLGEAGAAEVVRERLGAGADPAFVAACHESTGGNPLLLQQLLVTLAADGVRPEAGRVDAIRAVGPRAVGSAVRLRLARLPADAVAVARAVAVLGDDPGLPVTARLARMDDDRVAEAVRALVGAEILQAQTPLRFVHPLVRDAVAHELVPAQRELEHERAARALADLQAPPERVAAQLLASPGRADPWVVAQLRAAARSAAGRGVPESSAAYLRRALREPPAPGERPGLLLELGTVEALLNRPIAVEHLEEAHTLLPDPPQRRRAGHVLGRMLLFTRPPQEAVAVIRATLDDLPASSRDERRALEALELWAGVAFGAQTPDAAQRLEAVRATPPAAGAGARMLLAVAAWDWARTGGSATACADLALDALADRTLLVADPGFMALVAAQVLVLADRDEALDAFDDAMREARDLGSAFAICAVDQFCGWAWLQRGELGEAQTALRAAQDATMLVEDRDTAGRAYVTAFLGRVLLEAGDVAAAHAVMADAGATTPGSDGDGLVRRTRLELLLAESRWADALQETDRYRRALGRVDYPAWSPWRSLRALALDGLGETAEAIDLLRDEVEAARAWGAPGALSRALRLLGTAQRDAGLPQLEEAVAVAASSPARLEHAKALTALGSALRRGRRPALARDPLRAGFALADRCGARSLADAARAELRAAGGRPRQTALSGPGSLTPSERRVADLAAGGLSNRDIAQTLYVTPKTVEVHLTSAYRKLGILTRRALPQALAG
jgi:DNA-binding CsgD family transcriptional regulator